MPSDTGRALSIQQQYALELISEQAGLMAAALVLAASQSTTRAEADAMAAQYEVLLLGAMMAVASTRVGYLQAYASAEGVAAFDIPTQVLRPTVQDVLVGGAGSPIPQARGVGAVVDVMPQTALRAPSSQGAMWAALTNLKHDLEAGRPDALTVAQSLLTESTESAAMSTADWVDAMVLGPDRRTVALRRVAHPGACQRCVRVSGALVFKSSPRLRHPQCFPAGTVVSGPATLAATKRWYEGEMVKVVTASGRILTVTPNHPLLTSEGWVGAGELRKGSHLVAEAGLDRVPSGSPYEDQVPSLIEEVAVALDRAGAVSSVRVPASSEDFHGDGSDGYVDVVRAAGHLRDGVEVGKPEGKELFLGADVAGAVLSSDGDPRAVLRALAYTPDGVVGRFGDRSALLGAGLRHAERLRFPAATQFDPTGFQGVGDDAAAGVVLLGERLDTHAGEVLADDGVAVQGGAFATGWSQLGSSGAQVSDHGGDTDALLFGEALEGLSGVVALDEIVDVVRFPFAGHVYNLETVDGWYIANGFIVHNCRCSFEPVLLGDPEYAARLARYQANADYPQPGAYGRDRRYRGREQLKAAQFRAESVFLQDSWTQFLQDEQKRLASLVTAVPSTTYRNWAVMTSARVTENLGGDFLPTITRN